MTDRQSCVILVVAPAMVRPDTASGDLRFSKMLRILVSQATVHFLTSEERPDVNDSQRRYWDDLAASGVVIMDPSLYWKPSLLLKMNRYDWVLGEFWHQAERLLPAVQLAKRIQPWMRLAVDSVDVHFLREEAALGLGVGDAQKVALNKSRELATYRKADCVLYVTDEDHDVLLKQGGVTNLVHVPNLMSIRKRNIDTVRSPEMLFVGGFKHSPNVDAVLWFVREVFPLVVEQAPDVVFNIVGSYPPEEVQKLDDGKKILVRGFVSSTEPWIDAAAVSVAPLRYGAGMKGKVTEALCSGLPVVTTSFGAQGIPAVSGEHLLIADTANEFAAAVVELLRDPARAGRIGLTGQEMIAGICSEERAASTFRQHLTGLSVAPDSFFHRARFAVFSCFWRFFNVVRRLRKKIQKALRPVSSAV